MIKASRIVVIGAEHIGAALLRSLCLVLNAYRDRIGQATVLIVAPIHSESKLAELKKEFEDIEFAIHQTKLDEGNIAEIIAERSIVFCCVPNFATVKIVSDHCETLRNVTAIRGGCDDVQGLVQVFARKNGKNITLPFTNRYHPEISSPKNDDDAGLQTIFANIFVACNMLNTFYAYLMGRIGSYDEVYVDVVTQRARPYNRRSNPSIE